jgi:hypothetical protein
MTGNVGMGSLLLIIYTRNTAKCNRKLGEITNILLEYKNTFPFW